MEHARQQRNRQADRRKGVVVKVIVRSEAHRKKDGVQAADKELSSAEMDKILDMSLDDYIEYQKQNKQKKSGAK